MSVHGKDTDLWLDGRDLTGYANSADVSTDIDLAETNVFGNDWKTNIPGKRGATVSIAGLYDPDMTDVRATLSTTAASVLTVGIGGLATIGNIAHLGSVLTSSFKKSAPIGGVVAFDWGATCDGPLGYGYVLHALGAESADGSAAYIDGAAATTLGAIAHLHVTSVSASDSIAVIIEDSADHNSWATIGTFAAASAAGAERLVIAGTVRRYVRATWDVTGADVSITFGVALARL